MDKSKWQVPKGFERWAVAGFTLVTGTAGLAAVFWQSVAGAVVLTMIGVYVLGSGAWWVWRELGRERREFDAAWAANGHLVRQHSAAPRRRLAEAEKTEIAGRWHATIYGLPQANLMPLFLIAQNENRKIKPSAVTAFYEDRPIYRYADGITIISDQDEAWLPESLLIEWHDSGGFHCKFARPEEGVLI